MRPWFKRVVTILVCLLVLTSLVACSSSNNQTSDISGGVTNESSQSTSSSATETDNIDGQKVRVWVSSGAEDAVYKEMFDDMETRLKVDIDDEYFPKDELDSKLQVAPVVGDAPDLLILDYLNIPNLREAGLIENITDRLSQDIKSDLLQSVIDEATYDGQMLAVAQFDAGMAMWANKSMLEAAGARIPVSYKDAWSKQEFEEILSNLKASGVRYPIYLRQNKPSSMYFTYMPVLASFGGDYVNRKTMLTTGALDSAETNAAYSYISWLSEQGYINPNCDYEDGFFGRKESALALLGHWKYKDHVTNLGDDAILVPIPDFGHGVFTCSGSVVWTMTTAATKNGTADAVWAVMEDALSADNINKVTGFNGAIPSRKSVMDANKELQPGGRLYLYREQLEAGLSILRPLTPAHMTIYAAMESATSDIIHGAPAKETLADAAKSIDEIIVQNKWNLG